MSLLDSIISFFGVSTNKKKADSSPKNPAASERLTSSSNNGYLRRYESGECITNQSNDSLINNPRATSSLQSKVIPPITKSSMSAQTAQPRMSNALNPRIPTSSVPSSSTKANNTSSTSKPFFTSYSTPFNSSPTENASKSPIPILKTKFSASNITSSASVSSRNTLIVRKTAASTIKSTPSSKAFQSGSEKSAILPIPQTPFSFLPSATSLVSSTVMKNRSASPFPSVTSSTSFNTAQTKSESKKAISLSTVKKLTPPNSIYPAASRASSSKPLQSLASNVLNNEFKIQERPKTIPSSTVNNAVSNNLLKKFSVNNELKTKDSVLKASGSRQSKRKNLVDISVSKTSPKAAPVLNAISKKISTNKIQPVDNVENQIYKPLINHSKKKFSTVSSTFESSSSSSSELQSLTSNAVVESKKKKKTAAPKTFKVSKTVLNPTLKILEEKKKLIVPLKGKVEPKQEILPLSKNQKKRNAKLEEKRLEKLGQNGKTFNGKNNQLKNDNSKFGFVLPEETLSIENYYKSCNLTCKDGVYLDPNGHKSEFLMGCLI